MDRPLTMCVVGHGKSPEGKGWGPRIDSCDYVVRMWNWYWQNEADYGTKYDYGVLENYPSILMDWQKHNKHEPKYGYVVSKLTPSCCSHPTVADRLLPERSLLVDQQPWNAIGISLGGLGMTGRLQFTRGTVAACWAIETMEAGSQVVLIGFDNVYRGEALTISEGYPEAWAKDPTNPWGGYKPGRKYGNHDFACESPVMQYLAKKNGIEVVFAQDVWNDNSADIG